MLDTLRKGLHPEPVTQPGNTVAPIVPKSVA